MLKYSSLLITNKINNYISSKFCPYMLLYNHIKMGTGGLLGFIIQGRRYATWVHYDSYPYSLGWEIVYLFGMSYGTII